VEEVSFRSKIIEGVGTSTCGFAGPTRKGPSGVVPELLTSFADFERMYGGLEDLAFEGHTDPAHKRNYVAHAARAFFDNGGARLYVVRATGRGAKAAQAIDQAVVAGAVVGGDKAWFEARFVGSYFNGATVTVQQVSAPCDPQALAGLPHGSAVRVHRALDGKFAGVFVKDSGAWKQASPPEPDALLTAERLQVDLHLAFKVVLLSFSVRVEAGPNDSAHYDNLTLASIVSTLTQVADTHPSQMMQPVALKTGGTLPTLLELLTAFGCGRLDADGAEPRTVYTLTGGEDGAAPDADDIANALVIMEALEDVSVVAAPGYAAFYSEASPGTYRGVQDALLAHVAAPHRYRMAVLDAPPGMTPSQMRELRGLVDSSRAALYYPWIIASNPLAGPNSNQPTEIALPPCGHVCGIYARHDSERGVHKAPANELVRGALRFEPSGSSDQQDLLTTSGVNCLRLVPGRGLRVWGARTVSSDPDWKYLNVRRYFNYIEASIDRSTQWVVFEPNGERLWANLRDTIGDFLLNEWRDGALVGTKPEEAFFVRCDRTTMTQNDLDNGRWVCLIGLAVIKPAEFMILRIGKPTADATR
jgi:phage tail sheath protein FI